MASGSKQLKGVAWVTGAGTGIGRALARRLADAGWIVAVSARTQTDLETLALEAPDRIHPFALDVTDAEAVRKVAGDIETRLGTIDLAIFNAGTYKRTSATRFDVDAFRQTVDLNIMGTVECMAAIMPQMIGRRGGHIGVVASVSGYVGLPGASAYGATKAALINMCQSLQPELAAHDVRLQLINPGFVRTPLTDKNDFPMPFLIEVEEAVDHIMRGLESRRFEIVFPWQMAIAMKMLAALPNGLRLAITKRMVR